MATALDEVSYEKWSYLAPELFGKAGTLGTTKLEEDLVLVIKFSTGNEREIICPQGAEVYFPNHQNPQSTGARSVRKVGHCIIFCDDFHITLIETYSEVTAKFVSLKDRARAYAY